MAKYKIMSQMSIPSPDLKRAGKMDTQIFYLNVDKNASGTTRLPIEAPTLEEVAASIKAKEASPQNHTGKEITL